MSNNEVIIKNLIRIVNTGQFVSKEFSPFGGIALNKHTYESLLRQISKKVFTQTVRDMLKTSFNTDDISDARSLMTSSITSNAEYRIYLRVLLDFCVKEPVLYFVIRLNNLQRRSLTIYFKSVFIVTNMLPMHYCTSLDGYKVYEDFILLDVY